MLQAFFCLHSLSCSAARASCSVEALWPVSSNSAVLRVRDCYIHVRNHDKTPRVLHASQDVGQRRNSDQCSVHVLTLEIACFVWQSNPSHTGASACRLFHARNPWPSQTASSDLCLPRPYTSRLRYFHPISNLAICLSSGRLNLTIV